MLKAFEDHIENQLPFLKKSKLLVAVSGGLDSVVLVHLCHALKLDMALAHCNFKLRDDESDADEQFVVALADELNVEVFIENFDTKTYAVEQKLSIQMAARELRYNWFDELSELLNFDVILTAHHADDNLETFLINLSRGSGLSGLTGIPERNERIVRPLLPFSRQQLESYASNNELKWREDSSNASDDYLRNKLRHHVIPNLKEIVSDLLTSVNQTISNLNDTADIVDESLNAVAKRAITEINEAQIKFKVSEFKKVNNPKAYLFEMFKAYGFTAWNDIVGLLDAQSGRQVFSETHRLVKDREHLILTDSKATEEAPIDTIIVNDISDTVDTPLGTLHIEEVSKIENPSPTHIFVDSEKLNFPMEIRKWRKGDLFYPMGMRGKKKLSKYFKDEKISIVDKEKVWVLTSKDEIVWIIGKRADDRFKITSKTRQILKVSVSSN